MIRVIFQKLKTLERSLWLSNMEKIVVDGHPDLYRDANTGAIINTNSTEYESYIKTYRSRMTEKQRLSNLETDLGTIKSEIDEIKSLLKKLVDN